MEEQPIHTPVEEQIPGRPKFLSVVCILTFIGSGINIISSLVIYLFFDSFKIVAADLAKTLNLPGMDMITKGPALFFAASALIYAGAIAGAWLMWQLRKVGFHVYTVSQILLVIAPMYFFKLPGPGVMDVLLAGLFILLYARNLKFMT
jgi:hypothetical protein